MQVEYQTHLKEQYYLDQMKKDKEESQAALEAASEQHEVLLRGKEIQDRETTELMRSMETAHMRAVEELESMYERKLAAEAARYEVLRRGKEDLECQAEVNALHCHE